MPLPNSQPTEHKSIAIVGAGVAGLAAGCYAQMNGYRSQIFVLHDLPGSPPGQPFPPMCRELWGAGSGDGVAG
jgi:thioredoxin reductase